MNYITNDIHKNEGKDCILVSLLVSFNRKKWLYIQLWILLLMKQYRQRMITRITNRLPDWVSTRLLLKIDSIITKDLVGNDFKDGWSRLMEPVSACSIVDDSLKTFSGTNSKDIKNCSAFARVFEVCKAVEFSFNSKLRGFVFGWTLHERKYKWFGFCMKRGEEEERVWGYDEAQLLLCGDG